MLPITEFHFAFCGLATVAATLGYACARRAAALSSAAAANDASKADVEVGPPEERSLKRKLDHQDEHDSDPEHHPRPMKRNRTPPPPSYEHPREPTPEPPRSATPQPPQIDPSPNEPVTPPPRPATPLKPALAPANTATSPFASYSGASPFALSTKNVKATPAWRRDDDGNESDLFRHITSVDALAPSPNDPLSSLAIRPSTEAHPIPKPTTPLTGEENESVDADLKAVKLFIKRGRKEFTDGMYGHIKILTENPTHNEGETTSRTRLLFRRDPLGQVSMNVGLNPTVRCHMDPAENILRVILMEQLPDGNLSKEDVVIYAFKPGRAGKGDFQTFAKTLCDHEALKSRVIASTRLASPGDATAAAP